MIEPRNISPEKEKEFKLLSEEIRQLQKERNAVILVHNYQWPEVQLIADHLGDSLDLSRKAAESDADIIVFCGVFFMAESAKILAPEKTVLLPRLDAGCRLADYADGKGVAMLKAAHPGVPVVTYINSSAEVKALTDICCTSANAVQIVNSLPGDEVIMLPDMNLAAWVQKQTDKKIIPWEGLCPVHADITVKQLDEAKKEYPGAVVMAHPECRPEILEHVDYVAGTGGMLKLAKELDKPMIVVTETGHVNRMQRENPDKKIYPVYANMICPAMKKTTLESVRDALKDLKYKIVVDEKTREKAFLALDRMLEVV